MPSDHTLGPAPNFKISSLIKYRYVSFLIKFVCNAGTFCLCLQRISMDCTSSVSQHSVTAPSQVLDTYKTASVSRHPSNLPYAGSVFCRHETAATRMVNVDSLSGFHNRPLLGLHSSAHNTHTSGSHSVVLNTHTTQQPQSLLSLSVTLSSAIGNQPQSLGAFGRNISQPAFRSSTVPIHGRPTMQPSQPSPNFALPSSLVFRNQQQTIPNPPSSLVGSEMPSLLSHDHPSYSINRLREKIGRGWLPPEPPYPPPPDDIPETHDVSSAESRPNAVVFCKEQGRILAAPVGDAVRVFRDQRESFYAEPPQVDSTTEVTTTTDDANGHDDLETVTYIAKRPLVEREDGEISDDEPDSVGADLPLDSSSGISSSNWSHQSRPHPPHGGFRAGMVTYQPRFPHRGPFPRGRVFFRGGRGGFGLWRGQWYDHRPSRSWSATDDEHVVDSSGVLSPPATTETARKHSEPSSQSSIHSPISSTDSEDEETTQYSRSEHHGSKSDHRSRHRSKPKHDDHLVAADSTRTSSLVSPEFEASSDSDKEQNSSHSAAAKKKVCCSGFMADRESLLFQLRTFFLLFNWSVVCIYFNLDCLPKLKGK